MINIEMVKMRLPCVKCSGEGEHFVPAAKGSNYCEPCFAQIMEEYRKRRNRYSRSRNKY